MLYNWSLWLFFNLLRVCHLIFAASTILHIILYFKFSWIHMKSLKKETWLSSLFSSTLLHWLFLLLSSLLLSPTPNTASSIPLHFYLSQLLLWQCQPWNFSSLPNMSSTQPLRSPLTPSPTAAPITPLLLGF